MKKVIVAIFSFIFFSFMFLYTSNSTINAESKYVLYTIQKEYESVSGNRTDGYVYSIGSGQINGIKKVSLTFGLNISSESEIEVSKCYFKYDIYSNEVSFDTNNNGCDTKVTVDFMDDSNLINVDLYIDTETRNTFSTIFDYLNAIDHRTLYNNALIQYTAVEPELSNTIKLRSMTQSTSLLMQNNISSSLQQITSTYSEVPKITWEIIYDEISDYNRLYEQGFNDGQQSIDNDTIREEAYNNGFSDGQASVDITSNDEVIWNEAYQEGKDDGFILGQESVDIEVEKQESYDKGYETGYKVGFSNGESSVDITSDNDTVINLYIEENNYHTDEEFKNNYELGKFDGINFIYNNIENDQVVNKYVKDYIIVNNYHTDIAFVDNYQSGYVKGYSDGYNKGLSDGKEEVYQTIDKDPVVIEKIKNKLMNGTTINITDNNEVVKVVKKYDVDYDSDDDLIINIHKGQDKYYVDTVEEVLPGASTTNNNDIIDYSLAYKILGICAVVLVGVLLVSILIIFLSFIFKPVKKIGGKKYA